MSTSITPDSITTEQSAATTTKLSAPSAISEKWLAGYSRPSNGIWALRCPPDVRLLLLVLRAWIYRSRTWAYASDEVLTWLTGLYWRRFERARAWAVEAGWIDYQPGRWNGKASKYTLLHPALLWEPRKKGDHSDPLWAREGDHPVSEQRSIETPDNEAEARLRQAPAAPLAAPKPKPRPKPRPRWTPNEDWRRYFGERHHIIKVTVRGQQRYRLKVLDIVQDAVNGVPLSAPQLQLVAKALRSTGLEKADSNAVHLESYAATLSKRRS